MSERKPWHGVIVATALPFNEDLSVNYDKFGEHIQWLAENGCHGAAPNGSLGEYQNLTEQERAQVITTAVDAAPEGFSIMAGVSAYGALEAAHWAEQAQEAGADCVMLLPPNTHKSNAEQVKHHYKTVAEVGLPIVGYNNPLDTKVDLVPELIAEIFEAGHMVGVKEFTGDPRRIYAIQELAPDLDILIGTDDSVLEVGIAGAVGWVAGYPNAIPQATVELYELSTSGNVQDLERAKVIYRDLHKLLRWDTKTEFIESIKLSMDVLGRYGGPCRPPRIPLPQAMQDEIIADTKEAADKGYGK